MIQSVGAPVVTGERIPPVVEGQDGRRRMNVKSTDSDLGSMLDIYVYTI